MSSFCRRMLFRVDRVRNDDTQAYNGSSWLQNGLERACHACSWIPRKTMLYSPRGEMIVPRPRLRWPHWERRWTTMESNDKHTEVINLQRHSTLEKPLSCASVFMYTQTVLQLHTFSSCPDHEHGQHFLLISFQVVWQLAVCFCFLNDFFAFPNFDVNN